MHTYVSISLSLSLSLAHVGVVSFARVGALCVCAGGVGGGLPRQRRILWPNPRQTDTHTEKEWSQHPHVSVHMGTIDACLGYFL